MTHMQTYHIIQLQFWYRRFITYERYSTYINMIHFSWFFKCTICMYHISTYIQIYMAHILVHTPMISYDTYIFHALNGLFFRGFSSGALSDDHRAGSRPSHRQSPGRAHGAQFCGLVQAPGRYGDGPVMGMDGSFSQWDLDDLVGCPLVIADIADIAT